VVATNDVRFLTPEDFEAHEARVCIHERAHAGRSAARRASTPRSSTCARRGDGELFADIPEALENSVEIARRCNLGAELGKPTCRTSRCPRAWTPTSSSGRRRTTGLGQRHARIRAIAEAQRTARSTGAAGIRARDDHPDGLRRLLPDRRRLHPLGQGNGVPVGPGRGSGAGSLVAYALGITDLDPLSYDLLFERFLNPERVSMPDFDVDFCMEGRDRVIDYVADTLRPRARVADHHLRHHGGEGRGARRGARAGHPYGFVDKIAKLIPFELGITLDKALEKEPLLEFATSTTRRCHLIDLARARGPGAQRRQARRRRGDRAVRAHRLRAAVLRRGRRRLVTQFDKDDVEAAGLVKFDFLGLRTLTIIDRAVKMINAQRARRASAARHHATCRWTTRHLRAAQAGETTAVFQLESRGMKDLIKRLQPDCFEDIVALVALFRPGPLQSGMVDDFIAASTARRRPDRLPAPRLEPMLKPTYGVILYQEQVMQIAQVLAGYTLGGADLLRRAMGKKKPEEMAKQREIFVAGAPRAAWTGAGRAHLRPDGEVRRLRLQQVALGGLRAAVLPDGLAQAHYPAALHGRRAVGRHGQHRQGRGADRRVPLA
jgi:DNA polymerase-3 subunit alpha